MSSWYETAWVAVAEHCRFYVRFFAEQWNDMTPPKYTALLLGISVIGVLMMGRGTKR